MKQIMIVGSIVLFQLILTFSTQIFIIRTVGIGSETDSLVAAQALTTVLAAILASGLQSIWLPKLSASAEDAEKWSHSLSCALGQSVLLACGVFFSFATTAPLWIQWVLPGFDEEQIKLCLQLFLILSIASALSVNATTLILALRSQGKFYLAENTNLLILSISFIVIVFAVPRWGVVSVAYIILMRSVALNIILMRLAGRPRISLVKGWNYKSWDSMRPVLLGASLYKTMPVIDRYWASLSTSGGMTFFNLAQVALGSLATLLERAICVPIVSRFGLLVSQKNIEKLRKEYWVGIFRISIAIVIFLIAMILARDLFIDAAMTTMNIGLEMAELLWLICVSLVGYAHAAAASTLPVAVFHALGDTRMPVKISLIGFPLGLAFKAVGFSLYSLPGLAAALSAHYVFNMLAMMFCLKRSLHEYAR